MAEPLEALIVPLAANYDAILFPGDHDRQERRAARGGEAGRDASDPA